MFLFSRLFERCEGFDRDLRRKFDVILTPPICYRCTMGTPGPDIVTTHARFTLSNRETAWVHSRELSLPARWGLSYIGWSRTVQNVAVVETVASFHRIPNHAPPVQLSGQDADQIPASLLDFCLSGVYQKMGSRAPSLCLPSFSADQGHGQPSSFRLSGVYQKISGGQGPYLCLPSLWHE